MMILTCDHILAQPVRSFANLMELYENNYIFMRRLLPDLDRMPARSVSRVAGGVDLRLEVVERCPYTTMLTLTHVFDESHHDLTSPDLEVRIYHDARTAEALPGSSLKNFRLWERQPPPNPRSMAWRWEINRFLFRWLRYCLAEGHGFAIEN